MTTELATVIETFSTLSKKPHEYLSVQEESAVVIKSLIKEVYDYTKSNEDQTYKNTLPELIVDGFDEEQIWQELELQNGSYSGSIIQTVSELSVKKEKLKFPLKLKCISSPEEKNVKELHGVNETEDLEDGDEPIEENESEEDEELNDEEVTDEDISNETFKMSKKGKLKPSIVDDQFFKLSELELFLQNEDKKEDKPVNEKNDLDLFNDTDIGNEDYKYSDFFENPDGPNHAENKTEEAIQDSQGSCDEEEDEYQSDSDIGDEKIKDKPKRKPNEVEEDDESSEEEEEEEEQVDEITEGTQKKTKRKKVRFSLLGSDESSDESSVGGLAVATKKKSEAVVKSSLEERQERLNRMINRLEEEALSEKPWQLKGEVTASARPENSMLEEAVDFDLSVRPAPIMTGEVTLKLEDIIIQRIKDKAWDDVERKVKPVDTPSEFKKKLALDQEKSKLSLAEVYEKEYIKQREAMTTDDTERQDVEPALHVEVRNMLHSLFNKLDALSNYHYTPRPVAPELKVVSNMAAINMEEVAPVTASDSALLAPQEIKGKKRRSELMSKEERTDTDKKRARRMKKARQRKQQREKAKTAKEIAKINPGLGNKYSKLKAQKEILNVTTGNVTKMDERKEQIVRSSTTFFSKLQDEVKNTIKSKTSPYIKKKEKMTITAKKLKL